MLIVPTQQPGGLRKLWLAAAALLLLGGGTAAFIFYGRSAQTVPVVNPPLASEPSVAPAAPQAEVPPAPAAATATPPAPPPFKEQTWDEAVDLLKLVRVFRDTVRGGWRMEKEVMIGDTSSPASVEFPYIPPDEYDYRIVFIMPNGGDIGQILYANGNQFGWYMGSYANTRAGFQMIDGKTMTDNGAGVEINGLIQGNVKHTSIVEVRKTGVKAYVDGKLIVQYATDYKGISLFPESRLRGTNLLGIWSAHVEANIISAHVREVSGKGAPSMPSDRAPEEF